MSFYFLSLRADPRRSLPITQKDADKKNLVFLSAFIRVDLWLLFL